MEWGCSMPWVCGDLRKNGGPRYFSFDSLGAAGSSPIHIDVQIAAAALKRQVQTLPSERPRAIRKLHLHS
eukprot:8279458-Heterocapsa_arctica.AAC.1